MSLSQFERLSAIVRRHAALSLATIRHQVSLSLAIVRRPGSRSLAGGIALGVAVAVGAPVWFVYGAVSGLPDAREVRTAEWMPRSTTIVDVKGRHAFTIFQEQRLQVPLSLISPHLVQAIVAVEDQRFYDHDGVDLVRVMGAAWYNLWEGRVAQGGSTITQQLARLSFLTSDKTLRRKLQEVVLAARLEGAFSKDEILELYLNKAYFGDGLHGAEAASLGYFGKHAGELTLAEAALIAGLVQSPATYAPTGNPERALARRNLVLRVMRQTGAIDEPTFESAAATPLRLNDTLRREERYGQYFKEEVRKELVERFGWDAVYLDGLKVETTLDLDLQKTAETEVARSLREIEQRQGRRARRSGTSSTEEQLEAALVALDPRTGEVRALVGGRSFERSPFNRAMQARRQPGSAFKPFVYAAALEQGYTPASVISGLTEPVLTAQGDWIPEDHLEGDAITMREALRISSNRAAVRTLLDVGIPQTLRYASQLGVGSMPAVPSLALGSGEVTLLSLTSAFAAFANEGLVPQPRLIRRVTARDGAVLYESEPVARAAVSPATAFLVTSMLEDVVNSGTASRARAMGFRLPAAAKTGTTNDYRDAWLVGYTPKLVSGVWVGYDQPRTIINGGYAAELAVPLWTRFMMDATRKHAAESFRAPATVSPVTICRLSGRLATDACRRHEGMTYTEYFAHGTEPVEWCLHPRSELDVRHTMMSPRGPVFAPPPAAVSREAAAPPQAAPQEAAPSAEQPTQATRPKRGFWARVFGFGRTEDKTTATK